MSIPLERLYQFIEQYAQQIYGDRVIIYRFFLHGEKNIDNLMQLSPMSKFDWVRSPEIRCNDQEPLMYEFYERSDPYYNNLRRDEYTVWDKALLLHSEINSIELEKYINSGFIPVYYWSHALIARDWFRYAEHVSDTNPFNKPLKQFLIYNRAWSGSREYRLKFVDMLIDNDLVSSCNITQNPTDPNINIHYKDHTFINPSMKPNNILENYLALNTSNSWASADFDLEDYSSSDIEVVLETLFDDSRIQLTEKCLRPISLNKPFILVSSHNSLEYLKSYGFKTFSKIWDESYDNIADPIDRLKSVICTMKEINSWSDQTRLEKFKMIQEITDHNKKHFFSNKFTNQVTQELIDNLSAGFFELKSTNTGERYYNISKIRMKKHPKPYLEALTRSEVSSLIRLARSFRGRNGNTH